MDANRKLGLPDDIREYSAVRNIVDDLNIKSVALMTNNPRKINELEKEGVNVTSRIPCVTKANLFSEKYLEAKERRMSHVLNDSWRYFDNAGQVFESKDEADAKGDFSDYSMTWDEEDELGNIQLKESIENKKRTDTASFVTAFTIYYYYYYYSVTSTTRYY